MANTHTTPFIKRMRTQGGTIYTFSSSCEDIGININERNNIVKMSHYALLNIPSIPTNPSTGQNYFNVFAMPGALQSIYDNGSIKDGRAIIAESFQNYALNLECNLLDLSTYNAELPTTVSERVFWKWLKETGAIRWTNAVNDSAADVSVNGVQYWTETTDASSVVKAIGEISAGAVRNGTFGTYNETYILVPTSFGQTKVFFKQVEDDNYKYGMKIPAAGSGDTRILGRESYMKPHPDGLDFNAYYDIVNTTKIVADASLQYYDETDYVPGWWYTEAITPVARSYYTDSSTLNPTFPALFNVSLRYSGGTRAGYFKRSKLDCVSLELDLTTLKSLPVWAGGSAEDSTLTFDKMAIEYAINDNYDFNAVLLYYSVKNKTNDTVLATNLLGVLFLDPPSGNTTSTITLPSITKLQSGATGFGTSYSFRLNIKSDYMLDDTLSIVTDTTASQIVLEDFAQVFDGLSQSLTILNQHTGTINYITNQYLDISSTQTDMANDISDLQYQINDIARDITGTENAVAMFGAAANVFADSSIFMYQGKVGIFNNKPTFAIQMDGSVKVKDLYIENNVKDTSGHILLGYGSPLQLGSSTNYRGISMYTGNLNPAITIDACNNIWINGFKFADIYALAGLQGFPVRDSSVEGHGLRWGGGSIWVDVSTIAGGVDKYYVDISLNNKIDITTANASFGIYNASTNSAFTSNWSYQLKQDASIALKADFTYDVKQDASIALKTDFAYALKQDASIALKTDFAYALKQDASIAALAAEDFTSATNASVNLAFLTNASLGLIVKKTGDTMTGLLTINASLYVNDNITYKTLTPIGDGSLSTYIGIEAGASANITGSSNTAVGYRALKYNTNINNTALGYEAALNNTLGYSNTAVGAGALENTTEGYYNTAIGSSALRFNINGLNNIALGSGTLYNKKYGDNNVAIGYGAGQYIKSGTDLSTANRSIYIGYGVRGSETSTNTNEIVIGADASSMGNNTTVIGNLGCTSTYISGAIYLNNKNVFGVATPVNSSDAVNKSYVDTRVITKTFQNLNVINASISWTIASGYNARVTLITDASLLIPDVSNGDSGTLIVIQPGGTGGKLLMLPNNTDVSSFKNNAWTLTTDASARDIISFVFDGSNYYWNKGGSYA